MEKAKASNQEHGLAAVVSGEFETALAGVETYMQTGDIIRGLVAGLGSMVPPLFVTSSLAFGSTWCQNAHQEYGLLAAITGLILAVAAIPIVLYVGRQGRFMAVMATGGLIGATLGVLAAMS